MDRLLLAGFLVRGQAHSRFAHEPKLLLLISVNRLLGFLKVVIGEAVCLLEEWEWEFWLRSASWGPSHPVMSKGVLTRLPCPRAA